MEKKGMGGKRLGGGGGGRGVLRGAGEGRGEGESNRVGAGACGSDKFHMPAVQQQEHVAHKSAC